MCVCVVCTSSRQWLVADGPLVAASSVGCDGSGEQHSGAGGEGSPAGLQVEGWGGEEVQGGTQQP